VKLKVAVNASPLIFLAKAGLLHILRESFQEVHTTKGVLDEIAEPMKLGREAETSQVVSLKREQKPRFIQHLDAPTQK